MADRLAEKYKGKLIGVVGPCSAGKSTLLARLAEIGIEARHIAQEHSYVPDMWRKIVGPDKLIYLDVSYQVSMQRRHLDMTENEFNALRDRLSHARAHADLYLLTDKLTSEEVLIQVLDYLSSQY